MQRNTLALLVSGVLLAASCSPPPPSVQVEPRLISAGAAGDVTLGLIRDPALVAAIADISASEIRATDSVLVSFGTRHTMSDTVSNTRGIGGARRYLFNKLDGYSKACDGCLRIEYDPAMMEIRGIGSAQRSTSSTCSPGCWAGIPAECW